MKTQREILDELASAEIAQGTYDLVSNQVLTDGPAEGIATFWVVERFDLYLKSISYQDFPVEIWTEDIQVCRKFATKRLAEVEIEELHRLFPDNPATKSSTAVEHAWLPVEPAAPVQPESYCDTCEAKIYFYQGKWFHEGANQSNFGDPHQAKPAAPVVCDWVIPGDAHNNGCPMAVESAAPVVAPNWVKDLEWEGIAGAIIDTVHLTNEDYVNEKLVAQLKRYFGGSL